MNSQMLEQLKKITEEEQEILNGRDEIDKTRYTSSKTLVIDNKKLLESGKLIQIRPHTRFVHFPKHTHNYVEVIYMCAGETRQIINGEEVLLQAGELLFLNQHATQEIFPARESDIAVNFIILPAFFQQALSMIGGDKNLIRDFLVGCLCEDTVAVGYLHFKVTDLLPVQNLLENLIWSLLHDQQNERSINQVTMGLLFLQLLNCTDNLSAQNNSYEQAMIFAVLRYIEENYKDGSLSDLSTSMNHDLYWMSRVIKKLTGKTYTALLQTKRMNQAVFLLCSTGLSVAEIGLSVGYDNLSYFHRIFKETYGVSPREYRMQDCK